MASISMFKTKTKHHSEMELLDEQQDRRITRYFQEARHIEEIIGIKEILLERDIWLKYSKERMKTVSVALVLCLHIGVDPPDMAPKPVPCAKLEAWIDPFSCSPQKAAMQIATNLQKSYERWQPRARHCRYKTATDPTMDDVRKLCVSMRRNAKEERVLFHYNGHGVPRPTPNGEIWVFNKNFTQYIPLSIFDLQSWMEWPSIYVWDCASAETIVHSFHRFADDHEREWNNDLINHQENCMDPLPAIVSEMDLEEQAKSLNFKKRPKFRDCIQLAACRIGEKLPTHPDLPADLFTSCLTTPIQTSIIWYLVKSGRKSQFPPNLFELIPGPLNDRKTMMGELNWIFTAISDTIAWNSLPRDDFQKLFRQDLLLASLFRSFLLAERIMGANGCTVVSSPSLPSTADHPLWDSWEYTLDLTLNHVQNLIMPKINMVSLGRDLFFQKSNLMSLNPLIDLSGMVMETQESQHNWFFIEQLRAFEVWLEYGDVCEENPPQQLPVVLQVLLSQAHRLRALELLARFLDLGQWAVAFSLSVGVFPYVLKLLQSNTKELRPWLAFIWAKILAVEPGVQVELFKENGEEQHPRYESNHNRPRTQLRYHYFLQILNDPETSPRQKIVPAFILATLFHNNYRIAQENMTENGFVNLCTELLVNTKAKECRLLKLWLLIGVGRMWADFNEARWQAIRLVSYKQVQLELEDNAPEVRAAAVYALGCLVRNRSETNEHAFYIDQIVCDELCVKCTQDGAILVREELVAALQWYVMDFRKHFATVFSNLKNELNLDVTAQDDDLDEAADVLLNYKEKVPSTTRRPRERYDSNNRRRKHPSESNGMVEEIFVCGPHMLSIASSSEIGIAGSGAAWDFSYRIRAQKQIDYLKARVFNEPMQRTWLAILRLSLDPVVKVARMAQTLVKYVETGAEALKKEEDGMLEKREIRRMRASTPPHINYNIPTILAEHVDTQKTTNQDDGDEDLSSDLDEFDMNGDGSIQIPTAGRSTSDTGERQLAHSDGDKKGIRFIVGSPLTNHGGEGNSSSSNAMTPVPRKFSMPASSIPPTTPGQSTPSTGNGRGRVGRIPASSLNEGSRNQSKQIFTPKRVNAGDNKVFSRDENRHVEHKPLVHTEFVEWCGRIFVEPILDLIQFEDAADKMTDRVLTHAWPTDWAYHTDEGQRQQAASEFSQLKTSPADHQLVTATDFIVPKVSSFSRLRKIFYLTDGETLNINRYDKDGVHLMKSFNCVANNPFNTDKTTSINVINELSREMLLLGSDSGHIRIWDPSFNIHSHEICGEPILVTAAFPLSGQDRIVQQYAHGGKFVPNSTFYDWSQSNGRLTCAGNVKVIRVWDAHFEKTIQDIIIGPKKGAVTALSAHLDETQLIAVGFRNGSINVFDTRIPSADSLIMDLNEHNFRIMGVAVESDSSQRTFLAGASEDGFVCVWEPRMYKEPIVSINVRQDKTDILKQFVVHSSAQVFACRTTSNQVGIYDITGRNISAIKKNDPISKTPPPIVSCIAMHRLRLLTLVGYDNGMIGIHGQPKTII